MFVVISRGKMGTLQWSRPETNVSHSPHAVTGQLVLRWCVTRKCRSSSLIRCLPSMRHATRRLWYGLGERSTPRTTERNTAHSESVLTRLVVHSAFPDCCLYRVKKRVLPTIHAWIVPSCVAVVRVGRTTSSRT